ncbi:glucuronate isomerase [Vibrio hippocampi]|uniref:Uronate isomerase n=1 Tax=Vibrio hippocampi TaxID=654686 RepID=A0ABN8DL58_9VIBR|nr:glucuronate isomerase [Vibrio hippocampi]CAH0528810.1 Uronate isomerase [Vibrio hippocampi]
MNKDYINENYLLSSPFAQHLYHSFASEMPIIDYHNHLDAKEIWEDYCAQNIAQSWLHSDHYLWRAMRSNGIDEYFITGDATDRQKFEKWCETVPFILGNPLYQWSHLELKRFFGCSLLLNPENSNAIWAHCQSELATRKLSTRNVLTQCKVTTLCTTDSPLSELKYHQLIAKSDFEVEVLPTFRADDLFGFTDPICYRRTLNKLEHLTARDIKSLDDFMHAITSRMDKFHEMGCRLSDLGLTVVEFEPCSNDMASHVFHKVLQQQALEDREAIALKSYLFNELGKQYHTRNWAMQIHIGVLVNVNKRRKQALGGGTGFSVINDRLIAEDLTQLLSQLDTTNQLPKTVLYSVDPSHNAILCCIAGAFQDSNTAAGKIQFGAAWWFNDHKDGMEAQLTTLKNLGALGRFIGMLTDSRNIFSMSRHEYFRRVLCNLLANWVESGELPNDENLLKQTIENICYYNAQRYFNFPQHDLTRDA